jgi:DNA-binding NarL/FixJ family response regulator
MIVDDHPTLREGLAMLFEGQSDLAVVGQAADGQTALALCEQLLPDVILMDLLMPRADGIAALAAIHERFPHVRLIAFTSSSDAAMVRAALQAGASGYLIKTMELDDLAHAIRTVYAGEAVLAPEASRILIETVVQPPASAGRAERAERIGLGLTLHERQVLALMCAGHSNATIAEQLKLAPKTVRTLVAKIIAKLGVENRVQAVLLALQQQSPES